MTTTNYGIADEHGTDYTVGLQGEVVARRVAQRLADKHGKSVYLYTRVTMDDLTSSQIGGLADSTEDEDIRGACRRVLSEQRDGLYPVQYVEQHGADLEAIAEALSAPEEIEPTPAPARKVLLRTGTVGQHFGTCGVIHDITTGARLAEGATRPYGYTAAAISDVEAIAKERGYLVLTDGEAIEAGIDPETGERFEDESGAES